MDEESKGWGETGTGWTRSRGRDLDKKPQDGDWEHGREEAEIGQGAE